MDGGNSISVLNQWRRDGRSGWYRSSAVPTRRPRPAPATHAAGRQDDEHVTRAADAETRRKTEALAFYQFFYFYCAVPPECDPYAAPAVACTRLLRTPAGAPEQNEKPTYRKIENRMMISPTIIL